jgi:hypothetical protein
MSMAVFRSPPWKTLGVISKCLTYGKSRYTGRLLLFPHDDVGLGSFRLRRLTMLQSSKLETATTIQRRDSYLLERAAWHEAVPVWRDNLQTVGYDKQMAHFVSYTGERTSSVHRCG